MPSEDVDGVTNTKQELKQELEVYNKLKEPPKEESVLKFWSEKEKILPLLSKAARVTLSVPVSQASIERTFKSAVLTVTRQRSSLNSKLVETMVITKANNGRVDLSGIEEHEPAEYDSDFTDSSEDETDAEGAEDSVFRRSEAGGSREGGGSSQGQEGSEEYRTGGGSRGGGGSSQGQVGSERYRTGGGSKEGGGSGQGPVSSEEYRTGGGSRKGGGSVRDLL